MENVVLQMLEEYQCRSSKDYENALKEIMQEIALLGLWRSKFFEQALFYGGSALRILHKLPRFSEDMDFSLLKKNEGFNFKPYFKAIQTELNSYGFDVEILSKNKNFDSQIDSAFIKANTKIHFFKIATPIEILRKIQDNQFLKIKFEIDTHPPEHFNTEVKDLFRPLPFHVKTMTLDDLFAGKVHAVLARSWKTRVKGRDFFDYLWYIGAQSNLHLTHLEERLIQSGHWQKEEHLTQSHCKDLLKKRFQTVDFEQAKSDVAPFLKARERASLDLWTSDFFIHTIDKLPFNTDSHRSFKTSN